MAAGSEATQDGDPDHRCQRCANTTGVVDQQAHDDRVDCVADQHDGLYRFVLDTK